MTPRHDLAGVRSGRTGGGTSAATPGAGLSAEALA